MNRKGVSLLLNTVETYMYKKIPFSVGITSLILYRLILDVLLSLLFRLKANRFWKI